MKRFVSTYLFLFLLSLWAYCATPKYVFLFIGDGMATPQRMMAEEYSRKIGRGELVINQLPYHATTRTVSADSMVTDSAASGTAIACGEKTNNGRIGMDISGKRRLESVAEVAHQHGRKVGIVTSVTINHATPASFYAHRPSRTQYYAIGLDLINSGFEYFAGGGFDGNADKKSAPEYKGNLYELARKAGYKVVETKDDFQKLKPGDGKILARGCEEKLPFALDCDGSIPTLAEYTQKGIELLDNPKGFFMMVEGGAIDHCGHANDAAANLNEVLAFDDAVKIAVNFYKKNPDETLIVVTGDHETGGMTMGVAGTGYALYVDRLSYQKCSVYNFNRTILKEAKKAKKDFNFSDACALLTKYFGFQFESDSPMRVNKDELANLKAAYERGSLPDAARRLISAKAGVAWSSGNHTALPVLTTSMGPKAELFTGFFENYDISRKLKTLVK